MSLDDFNKNEVEDNEMNNMRERLELTSNLVLNLSKQLQDLKDSVRDLR
jgi:hypothetical protein